MMVRAVRSWFLIGTLIGAQLLVGVVVATGAPDRTQVAAIELGGGSEEATTEEATTEAATTKKERRDAAQGRRARNPDERRDSEGTSGAAPAPAPAPAPAGDDDDDEDRGDRTDEGEGRD